MLVVERKKIESLLKEVSKDSKVFDVKKDNLPFKQYFIPPYEELFVSEKGGKIKETKKEGDFILYGLDLKDLEALTQLDQVMEKPNKDFFYFQNRERSVVIGVMDQNIDIPLGGDVVFYDLGEENIKVTGLTPKGEKFLAKHKKFFKELKKEETIIAQEKNESSWSGEMRELLKDSEKLSDAVKWSKNNPLWDELAQKCLGCGVCTYVCPLCYCFSNEDKVELTGTRKKCRYWDACTLPGFAKVAGGHNFRPSIKERYYNWFFHKFVRGYSESGKSLCVGCGRCKENCPAQIDIKEVLTRILEEYGKYLQTNNS